MRIAMRGSSEVWDTAWISQALPEDAWKTTSKALKLMTKGKPLAALVPAGAVLVQMPDLSLRKNKDAVATLTEAMSDAAQLLAVMGVPRGGLLDAVREIAADLTPGVDTATLVQEFFHRRNT